MISKLLVLYNATVMALNKQHYTNDTAELSTKVEKAVLNNECIQQCCQMQADCFQKEWIDICTQTLTNYSYHQILACAEESAMNLWPHLRVINSGQNKRKEKCTKNTLDDWNKLAFASKSQKVHGPLTPLEACFFPKKVPIAFQDRHIKLAHNWIQKAFEQRQIYLEHDITEELFRYHFSTNSDNNKGSGNFNL